MITRHSHWTGLKNKRRIRDNWKYTVPPKMRVVVVSACLLIDQQTVLWALRCLYKFYIVTPYAIFFFFFIAWVDTNLVSVSKFHQCFQSSSNGEGTMKSDRNANYDLVTSHTHTHTGTHMHTALSPTPPQIHTQLATVPAAMAPMSGWMVTAQG